MKKVILRNDELYETLGQWISGRELNKLPERVIFEVEDYAILD